MEQRIIEAAARRRQPLPDAIAGAPEVLLGLEAYYEAFVDLGTCRPIGLGLGPIPWTAVDRYAQRHGYDSEESFAYLLKMIRAMDDAFLAYHRQKQEESSNGNK